MNAQQTQTMPAWSNHDNYEYFYNKTLTKTLLKSYSIRGGLENGCDISSFYTKLKCVNSVLEVGAGYGRVLNFLLQQNFLGTIDAIEKSDTFFEDLKQYADKVNLHHIDILKFSGKQFDAILSMWSGISDFSKEEASVFLEKLATLLHDNGTIYMDTSICDQQPLNAEISIAQTYMITEEGCTTQGYIPSFDEMQAYCQQVRLKIVEHYIYKTDAERNRMIYILQKSSS